MSQREFARSVGESASSNEREGFMQIRKRYIILLVSAAIGISLLLSKSTICVAAQSIIAVTEWREAPAIHLGNSYSVTQMEGEPYIQFTAPESASYRVTVEDVNLNP